jgi:hypothetical protein
MGTISTSAKGQKRNTRLTIQSLIRRERKRFNREGGDLDRREASASDTMRFNSTGVGLGKWLSFDFDMFILLRR